MDSLSPVQVAWVIAARTTVITTPWFSFVIVRREHFFEISACDSGVKEREQSDDDSTHVAGRSRRPYAGRHRFGYRQADNRWRISSRRSPADGARRCHRARGEPG